MKQKHLMIWGLALLVLILPAPLAAQSTPEAAAQAYYEFLLTATLEDYEQLGAFICDPYLFDRVVFEELVNARQGAVIDLGNVRYSQTESDANRATVTISGEPRVGGGVGVALPASVALVRQEDGWRVCPPGRHIHTARAEDMRLSEADARQAAQDFYEAFYTGDAPRVFELSCLEKLFFNLEGVNADFMGGYALAPNDWSFDLIPDGLDYIIQTRGSLRLVLGERSVVVNDRADFPNGRLVRENGWKFCGGYQEGRAIVLEYLRLYFGDAPPEALIPRSCPEYQAELAQAAQNWSLNIEQVNLPTGLFPDAHRQDLPEAYLSNLQALLLIGGDQVVSAGSEFGASVRLVRAGNQWLWCGLPLALMEDNAE